MTEYINIDPAELSTMLSRDVFSKFAEPGYLQGANKYGVHVFYGREGSSKQGHILFTFISCHGDMKLQIDFNVTEYVHSPESYLQTIVADMMEMIETWKADQSPIIVADPSKEGWTPLMLESAISQEIN